MKKLYICVNQRPAATDPSCGMRGSIALATEVENLIRVRQLPVSMERVVCFGHCRLGPNARLAGGEFIHGADLEKIESAINAALADK